MRERQIESSYANPVINVEQRISNNEFPCRQGTTFWPEPSGILGVYSSVRSALKIGAKNFIIGNAVKRCICFAPKNVKIDLVFLSRDLNVDDGAALPPLTVGQRYQNVGRFKRLRTFGSWVRFRSSFGVQHSAFDIYVV